MVGSSVANRRSFASTPDFGQRVEESRFAGVGVTHQGHDWIRHTLPRLPMKPARPLDLFELFADFREPFADQTTVGFDLRFTGAAEEAEAAALTFQVSPAFDQAAALIRKMREFDLQAAFPGLRAFAEDLENEGGAIENFGLPRLLQIALLDGAQMRIDDDHFGFEAACIRGDLFDLAATDECCRNWARHRNDHLRDDLKADRRSQPAHSARRASASRSWRSSAPRRLGLHVYDESGARLGVPVGLLRSGSGAFDAAARFPAAGSDPAASLSRSRACRRAALARPGAEERKNCRTK